MKNKKYGIDIDEILAGFVPGIIPFHNERYGTSLSIENFHSYIFSEVWGGTEDEAIRKVDEFFFDASHGHVINPINGAFEGLTDLRLMGYELVAVTARGYDMRAQTEIWIEQYFPNLLSDLYFANTFGKGVRKRKWEVCKEIGIDVLVEDNYLYAHECVAYGNVGSVLLMDYPWNRIPAIHPVERVHSWNEIVEKVKAQ